MKRLWWLIPLAIFLLGAALPPGAPDVEDTSKWRLVQLRFMFMRQQGTDKPFLIMSRRYIDSDSQNEVEMRYSEDDLISVLWGKADSDKWDNFYLDRGFVVCVDNRHIIPSEPKITGEWYDAYGPEAEVCITRTAI